MLYTLTQRQVEEREGVLIQDLLIIEFTLIALVFHGGCQTSSKQEIRSYQDKSQVFSGGPLSIRM
jgi:hypothetical protein